MVTPYLPDIIQGCVARIDASFFARGTDPFHVFFDKGILPQVKRSIYKADGNFPLVWLVMKYDEIFGSNFAINSIVSFELVIAMPTEPGYTQQQREDTSFTPRLIPICNQLMLEIARERWFIATAQHRPKPNIQLLPYWGMGDVDGADQPNLFKNKFIDAISVKINALKVRRRKGKINDTYPVADLNQTSVLYEI